MSKRMIFFALVLIAASAGAGYSATIWSENFESGTLGAFTDCPANPDCETWAVTDETDLFYCGDMPCEGAFYAIGDSAWFAQDKIDIMWAGPIDISGSSGKIEAVFNWVTDFGFIWGDELRFYVSCEEPADKCNPDSWTELWFNESAVQCEFGEAAVDMTPVVGCPASCAEVYIGFGYAGNLAMGVAVDDFRLVDGGSCPGTEGEDCSNPHFIECSDSGAGLLVGKTDDYDDADYGCSSGGTYDGGDEVWELEIPQRYDLAITLNDTLSESMDLFVKTGCPDGDCLAWHDRTVVLLNIIGVLYVFVDCPAGGEASYSLNATCTAPSGDDCSNPVEISCGDCIFGNTTGFANDYSCDWIFHRGPDVVYHLSVAEETTIALISEADYWAEWGIATVCDATTGDILCDDLTPYKKPSCSTFDSSNLTWMFYRFAATPGDYYFWVDGMWGADAGPYFIELICATGDNCGEAVPVTCDETVAGDSSGLTNAIDESTYGALALGDALGPDAWYSLGTVEADMRIECSVTNNDVYILDGCANCLASGDSEAQWLCEGTEDIYIVVDSNEAEGGGAFDLTINCQSMFAGITIGDATCTDFNPSLPFDVFSMYYETQYCIPAAELAAAGLETDYEISEMAWLLCSGEILDDPTNTVDIWLDNVSGPCPDLCLGGIPNGTLVVSDRRFSGTGKMWIEFALDTPFLYEAGNNLLISVCDSTGEDYQSGVQYSINWNLDNYWGLSTGEYTEPFDCDLTTDVPEDCHRYWTTLGLEGVFINTPTPTVSPTGTIPTPTETPTPSPTTTSTPWPGNNCSNPIEISCGDCVCGRSYGPENSHDCEPGWGHDGPDLVYHLYVPGIQDIQVVGEARQWYDADWAISTVCDDSTADVICADHALPYQETSCSTIGDSYYSWGCFNYTFAASGDYYIWVDGYNSDDYGDYCLEIICTGEMTPTATVTPTPTPTQTGTLPTLTATPTSTPTPTPPPGENCDNPIAISCGDCVCGDTTGYANDHDCTTIDPLEDHAGPDVAYLLTVPEERVIQLIGEADYDADWTIATVCDEDIGDILCEEWIGPHLDPSCSAIEHADWGYMNYTFTGSGEYYIWVDGFETDSCGNYCLEALCVASPTPTPAPEHDGDVDGDGSVTPNDSYLSLQIYLEMNPPGADHVAADFCPRPDGDGSVDPGDAYGILREYLGYSEPCD